MALETRTPWCLRGSSRRTFRMAPHSRATQRKTLGSWHTAEKNPQCAPPATPHRRPVASPFFDFGQSNGKFIYVCLKKISQRPHANTLGCDRNRMPLLSKASNVVHIKYILYDITSFTQKWHSISVATKCKSCHNHMQKITPPAAQTPSTAN